MNNNEKWSLTDDEKEKFINALTPELATLRTKADISQDELASLIGVSRQTYGAIERNMRKMSWNTFLSLILFYDYNKNTHDMLRAIGAFPYEIIKRFNDDCTSDLNISAFLGTAADSITEKLDEQAMNSIRTMIMLEYARCTNTPGTMIIKSFDGTSFISDINTDDIVAAQALKKIKESNSLRP